jgi:hypothetical protein
MTNLNEEWKAKVMKEYLEWRKAEGIPSLPNDEPDERTKEEKQRQWTKNYYDKNRDKLLEYYREYHDKHREERLEQRRQWGQARIVCDVCGCSIRRDGQVGHERTKKHREAIK